MADTKTEAAPPAAAEIQAGVVPEGYKVLKEGSASILQRGNDVFYNEAQVTNRDLSTAVLRQFLPMLAKEHAEGKYRKMRQQKRQQRKTVNAGKQPNGATPAGGATQQAAGSSEQQPAEAVPEAGADQAEEADQEMADAQEDGTEAQPAETQATEAQAAGGTSKDQAASQGNGAQGKARPPRGATVLEGLAASGLRSIRYASEIPGIKRVDANDLDKAACESIKRNVAFNGGKAAELIRTIQSDARITMIQAPLEYDVIDLDPYGTPSQLLDSAVQSVAEGGILLITATDMANLCGNNSVACWSNYGSYPLHRSYCHEQALRILLASINSHAIRYKRYIKPLLSVSVDFYIRVFVRVFTGPAIVKEAPEQVSYVWQSSGCDSFWLQPVGQQKVNGKAVKFMPAHGPAVPDMKCPDSGSGYLMGGPIWSAPIHDVDFVKQLIKSLDADKSRYAQYSRIRGMLQSVSEELPDAPLYYNLHDVCKTIKCTPFKAETFKSAIINAGYRVSGSHANPLAIKTTAPPSVIWDIMRCWVKEHPVNIKDATSYAGKILSKEPELTASFVRAAGAVKQNDAPRFVQNPAYWGPKARHGRPQVTKPESAAPASAPADKGVDKAAVNEEKPAGEGNTTEGQDQQASKRQRT